MALDFSGSTAARVDCGSDSSLDNVTAGSALLWVYPGGTNTRRFFQKALFPNALGFQSGTNIELFRNRATTGLRIVAAAADMTTYGTGKWCCLAATWDIGDVNNCKLFHGDLATLLAEPSSYSVQQAGSGSAGSDAAENFIIGNLKNNNTAYDGVIGIVLLFNRVLSAGELRSLQFRPRPISGCVGFWVLGRNGTGTQGDLSSHANSGTVTSATLADPAPLARLFGRTVRASRGVAASSANLAGTAAGVGAATGTLAGAGALAGSSSGAATATGTVAGAGALAGATAGAATASGTLAGTGALAGSAAGQAAATGTLAGAGALAGAAAGVATATGTIHDQSGLAGTAAGVATVTGTLAGAGQLAGLAAGTGAATGSLAGSGALGGSTAGVATVTGTLAGSGALVGTIGGVATITGSLVGAGALAGSAAGVGAATGDLSDAAAVEYLLAAIDRSVPAYQIIDASVPSYQAEDASVPLFSAMDRSVA